MSDSSLAVVGELYGKLASEMIKHAMKLTDGDYHLAYALLNSATERLRSRNHIVFSVTMVGEMQDATKRNESDPTQDQTTKGTETKEEL